MPAPSFILFGQLATSAAFVQVTMPITLFALLSRLAAPMSSTLVLQPGKVTPLVRDLQ